jgi:hypothetical protein
MQKGLNKKHTMKIIELEDKSSSFDLVELKEASNGKFYPHCKIHGAMNKVSAGENGIWRCLSIHSLTKIVIGNSISYKENDTVCRAAAKQLNNNQ